MNPGNPHAIARTVFPHFGSNSMNSANDLVTQDKGELGRYKPALNFVEFRMANTANRHLDQEIIRSGGRDREIHELKRLIAPCFNRTAFFEHHRSHYEKKNPMFPGQGFLRG